MSSTQQSDLALVISNYVRNNYETKYDTQHIPIAIKYLMLKFSNKIIDSSLLSLQNDLDFFNMLKGKLRTISKFDLLFRASENNHAVDKFHSLCDDKGATITIIQSNHGNIFGGYTSKSWASSRGYIRDENAFLFLIKTNRKQIDDQCPLLFDIKEGEQNFAIHGYKDHGPVFGSGHNISIWPRVYCYTSTSLDTYDVGILGDNLCGSPNDEAFEHRFDVIDYEIFQVA